MILYPTLNRRDSITHLWNLKLASGRSFKQGGCWSPLKNRDWRLPKLTGWMNYFRDFLEKLINVHPSMEFVLILAFCWQVSRIISASSFQSFIYQKNFRTVHMGVDHFGIAGKWVIKQQELQLSEPVQKIWLSLSLTTTTAFKSPCEPQQDMYISSSHLAANTLLESFFKYLHCMQCLNLLHCLGKGAWRISIRD